VYFRYIDEDIKSFILSDTWITTSAPQKLKAIETMIIINIIMVRNNDDKSIDAKYIFKVKLKYFSNDI